jgi:hypothetical protein
MFADFFTNSSGHPGQDLPIRKRSVVRRTRHDRFIYTFVRTTGANPTIFEFTATTPAL